MKICTILVLLILASLVIGQKTEQDKSRESLESENIKAEKECRFEMNDGQYLSLYHMKKKRAPDYIFKNEQETGLYTYYFNFCSPTIMTCNGEEDALAIQKIGDDCIGVLARGAAYNVDYIDENKPNKGVKLVYDGGDACDLGNRRVEHILK